MKIGSLQAMQAAIWIGVDKKIARPPSSARPIEPAAFHNQRPEQKMIRPKVRALITRARNKRSDPVIWLASASKAGNNGGHKT